MSTGTDSEVLKVDVVADLTRYAQQIEAIERKSQQAGRRAGQAFGEGAKDLGVFSRETQVATQGLTGLAVVLASRATSALRGFTGLVVRTTSGLIDLGALGALRTAHALEKMAEATRDANGELSTMGKAGKVAATGVEVVAKVMLTVSAAVTGAKIAVAAFTAGLIVAAHRASSEFEPAWNRVLTALDGSRNSFFHLRGEVSRLAASLGIEGKEAADTFYEILSVMPELAGEPARALELLRVSLEASATGFTDAATAAKSISSILNAFGMEVEEARRVSDKFFVTQGLGATTFEEMAESLSRVSGLVASLGLTFEDVFAIVATVTQKIGTPTNEVMTQLRAALTNIIKPSQRAAAEAEKLGIDFSAAALQAKGLNGFILELIEATEGSTDTLATLFGSDEAILLLTALAQHTDTLRERIGDVNEAAGAHDKTVKAMNDSYEKQKEILGQQLPGVLRDLGFEFDGWAAGAVRAINSVIFAMRGLDAEGKKIARAPTPWAMMEDAVREERSRRASLPVPGARPKPAGPKTAAQIEAEKKRYTAGVVARMFTAAAVAPSPASTDPEDVKASIESLRSTLQAQAVAQYALTKNTEQYEAATRRATERVNALVISEVNRLRASGATEAVLNDLIGAYQVLGDQADRAAEAEQKRRDDARSSLDRRTRAFSLLTGSGVPAFDQQASDLPGLLRQVIQLDREIASIEQEIETARNQAPAAARELLAAYHAQRDAAAAAARAITQGVEENVGRLDTLRARIVEISIVAKDLAGPAVQLDGGGVVTLTGQLKTLADATRRVHEAEAELQAAYRSGDKGRIARERKEHAEAEKQVAKATAAVQRALDAGRAKGIISQSRYNELVRQLVALLEEAGIKSEDVAAKTSRNWEETAQTVAGLARGVLSVADAMGILDDESRRALQGLVDVADAVTRIAANSSDVGAWVQGIGGGGDDQRPVRLRSPGARAPRAAPQRYEGPRTRAPGAPRRVPDRRLAGGSTSR